MTQITQEQREHFEVVAAQATAKLEAFRDGLTADEQTILRLGLWQAMAKAAGADESVAGFAANNPVWKKLGEMVVSGIVGSAAWSAVEAAADWITEPSDAPWPGPPSH